MFIQTFQLREARAAVSDPVYTGPARLLNRQVLYFMCNAFTRNRANSVTDCSTVYTSPHKFAGRLKTCTAVLWVQCERKTDPCKFLSVLVNGISVSLFLLSPSGLSLNHCLHLKNLRDFLTIQFYYYPYVIHLRSLLRLACDLSQESVARLSFIAAPVLRLSL